MEGINQIMMEDNNLFISGDINDVIKTLDTDSIDFIYTDPPFAITGASWDKGLNWKELFPEMWRVLKPNGVICLYASCPFTYELLQYEKPKYHYSWIKNNKTGFFQAKRQPLRQVEEIFVYYKKNGTYNPQMIGDEFHKKRTVIYGGQNKYYGDCKVKDGWGEETDEGGHKGRYPTTFKNWDIRKDKSGITRTDEQIDYFIKTYSNEGETILDMTCHNDYVSKRCGLLKRNYIGVDINI